MIALVVALALAAQEAAPPPEDRAGPTCLTPALFAAAPCAALGGVGGLALVMGGLFTTIDPAAGADNCVEQCVLSVFAAAFVVLGISLGVAGALLLGPVAALAVVGTATVATLLFARSPLPAIVGGAPGVVVGIAGLVVAGAGLAGVTNASGALDLFDVSRAPQATMWIGLGIAALAAPLSLAGVVVGDALFGAPLVEEEDARVDDGARPVRFAADVALSY